VAVDLARVAAVIDRIAADVDELARARRAGDRGLSNNGTVSGDSELKTAGLLAAIRICSLVAERMAMVVITESERVVCSSLPTRCSLRLAWRRAGRRSELPARCCGAVSP
jgi:hypothetical protein